jgi:hypothetical protein
MQMWQEDERREDWPQDAVVVERALLPTLAPLSEMMSLERLLVFRLA